MKNQVLKDGWHMPFTAATTVAGGDLIKVGSLVGVATGDVASGEVGELCIHGVFTVGKTAPEVIGQGDAVYYVASTGKVTTTPSGNTFCGYAWADGASADTTIDIKLEY